MSPKFIFITGGVLSSLGKGLLSASIGTILEGQGVSVGMLKFDPYLNVDPGTMNPFQHGEVYVTEDGAETDLDIGHYYRFTNARLSRGSNVTAGQIYDTVIKRERRGDYRGNTVQVIPHVTDAIKAAIMACANQESGREVLLVEVGGTVGDIESQPFLEAIRQFRLDHPQDCIDIHLAYVPYLKAAGEVKTKPTQHAVQALRHTGIFPNIILCRSESPLDTAVKEKIALFCSVPRDCVLEIIDVQHTIYELPLRLIDQQLDEQLCTFLQRPYRRSDVSAWERLVEQVKHPQHDLVVGLVGKYTAHRDAYKSVCEALQHAGIACDTRLVIRSIEADQLEQDGPLDGCDGYIVPGGFGERGWEGIIAVAHLCREQGIPYFGICLGMQAMAVAFARYVLKLAQANSIEIDPDTSHPIITLLAGQEGVRDRGGTMRLGAYPCCLKSPSKAYAAYGVGSVGERHRHRYEFNNAYREACAKQGLRVTGTFVEEDLVEILEVADHPWMLGVQFHPEFQSKPLVPHPLFLSFVKAMLQRQKD